jgi:M6 family metalloprotease-like protein
MKKIPILLLLIPIVAAYDASAVLRRSAEPSRRNLVSTARYRWVSGALNANSESIGIDTLRVLGVMVEFKPDRDDKTTGDGRFDLGPASGDSTRGLPPEAKNAIDPPPHDRSYFLAQLKALSNYYKTVSKGRLVIVGDVFEPVVTLPDSMRRYHPGLSNAEEERGLAELARDGITAADALGAPLSNYKAFILFHAGVGGDIDLGYDYTDGDIPSGFVDGEQLGRVLGLNSGIPLRNGQYVPEVMILPETENQDGIAMGLLGTEALMFGFQLGLPALWDTQTGRSGAGRWSLMDQGSGNYQGLIPAEPCAFSRYWLGWDSPIEIREGGDLPLGYPVSSGQPTLYRVPINDHEYFLIENRQHDPDGDGVARGLDAKGNQVIFGPDSIETAPSGVIVSVDDYDYGLPGSGILIWHVDEALAAARLAAGNPINPAHDVRAVDLEEADGAQDIGQSYGMLAGGAGSEYGVLEDAWFADNAVNLLVNHTGQVRFSPNTYPSTAANSGARSDITVYGFSKSDTVMRFSVSNSRLAPGFPKPLAGNPFPPLVGELDGRPGQEILVATREGNLYAWTNAGEPLAAPVQTARLDIRGDSIHYQLALFASINTGFPVSPVLADLDADGRDEIVAVDSAGTLLVWRNLNPIASGVINDQHEKPTGLGVIATGSGPVIVMGTASGRLTGFNSLGNVVWTRQFPDTISGFCGLGMGDTIAVASGKTLYRVLLSQTDPVFTHETALGSPSAVRIGDETLVSVSDGTSIFIVNIQSGAVRKASVGKGLTAWTGQEAGGGAKLACGANGRIYSLNANGSLSDYFPVPAERMVSVSDPVIGDVDGDGSPEIVTTNSNGEIEAWKTNGKMADGFPLSVGGNPPVSPVLADVDGDGQLELVAVGGGEVFVWKLDGRSTPLPAWGFPCHDPAGTAFLELNVDVHVTPSDWMPDKLVYNYPNPAEGQTTFIRYRLYESARVKVDIFDLAGNRVAELSGPGDAGTDNEVAWNLSGVSNGVYFCKVRAEGQHHSKTVTIKIAVAK